MKLSVENLIRFEKFDLSPNAHPGVEHPKAIEADFQMKDGMLILDIRAPWVGYALRSWVLTAQLNTSLIQENIICI